MKKAPLPNNEPVRQQAVEQTGLAEQPSEERFDRLTRLAKQHFGVPIVIVTLLDDDRQQFKSCQGLDVCGTTRDISFCGHAIYQEQVLVVENALEDPRFHDNPLVTGPPYIRFYAGVPFRAPTGYYIGTFCIIDTFPRQLSSDADTALRDFAGMVEEQLQADAHLHTSRAGLESSLVESERRARLVIEGTRVGTWQWNVQTGETVFNERWAEIAGYTLEELQPTSIDTWMGLAHPDDLKESETLLKKHFKGESQAYDCKARMRHKDGHWVWVHDRGQVFDWDGNGDPLLMYGTHADITAEVEAEQALKASRDEFESLVANMPGMTYRCRRDDQLSMLYASDQVEQITGYSPQTLIDAERVRYQDLIHPDDQPIVRNRVQAALENGEDWHIEYRIRNRDDRWRWVEERGRTISRQTDNDAALEGFIVDVTQEREAREQLGRHHKALSLLSDIALNGQGDCNERIDYALRQARQYLGMDVAILSRIEGQTYILHHVVAPASDLAPDDTVPLGHTWCQLLFEEQRKEYFIPQASQSQYRGHPCYREFPLGQYAGVVIEVEGNTFGTLNFSAAHERAEHFGDSERLFVQLLGQWMGEELERKETSERLGKLLEQVPGMIYQFRRFPDGTTTFPFSSPGIRQIYGITPEAAIEDASMAYEAMHPDDLEPVATSIEASAATLEKWHATYRVRAGGGEYRWVNGQARPEPLSDGSVLWHGYIHDIHDQEQARQAMERNEARLRSLFEFSPIGIALNDLETGQFLDLNDALYKPTGYTREEFVNLNYWDLTPSHYYDGEQEALQRLRSEGRYGPFEKEYIRKDGTRYPVRLQGILTYDPDGHPLIWSLIEDISERRRLDRMKDQFIATISHELRTPLTSISGSLRLLAGGAAGPLPEKAANLLDNAKRNSERLASLINDLLDMEKLVSGKMPITPETQALAPILNEAVESMTHYGDKRSIELQLETLNDDLMVHVDNARLQQALTNLISNAIKFSPEESAVEITTEQAAGMVTICVRDHGPGVDPSFQHMLFNRFAQADGSDTRQLPGTGLGLAITREIVESMSGSVFYRDAEGGGSAFHVRLPLITH
ncbi:MAG: PAS domain-containing protein [Halospina sp.]